MVEKKIAAKRIFPVTSTIDRLIEIRQREGTKLMFKGATQMMETEVIAKEPFKIVVCFREILHGTEVWPHWQVVVGRRVVSRHDFKKDALVAARELAYGLKAC